MPHQLTHPDFRDFLISRLSQPLPGQMAQFQMAPLARQQPEMASVHAKKCREAGVLALFYPDSDGMPALLLTVRPKAMNKHAGQVAFPGGRREKGEDLEETALRETEEEVLIHRSKVDVLGTLSSLYIPPSNFCVYPFIGCIDYTPDLSVRTEEVADMFGVPVSHLIDAERRRVTRRSVGEAERDVPHFLFQDRFVWGATAMMISELAAVLQPSLLVMKPLVRS